MVFHGNELSIGIIFAAWMIWVGVGSRVGAIVVERLNRPIDLLFITAAAALCSLPATICCFLEWRRRCGSVPLPIWVTALPCV